MHAGSADGERIVGIDAAHDGERKMPGGHHGRRHVEDDTRLVDQLYLVAFAHKGYRSALAHGDPQLVGQKTHDGCVLDPRDVFQFGTALGERDEEDVAADVRTEDGEQIFAGELTVAHGLNGGGGVDAKARVAIEEIAYFNHQPGGCC